MILTNKQFVNGNRIVHMPIKKPELTSKEGTHLSKVKNYPDAVFIEYC